MSSLSPDQADSQQDLDYVETAEGFGVFVGETKKADWICSQFLVRTFYAIHLPIRS